VAGFILAIWTLAFGLHIYLPASVGRPLTWVLMGGSVLLVMVVVVLPLQRRGREAEKVS
jgi:hypothetical protein